MLTVLSWNQVIPTKDQRMVRREKRDRGEIDRDRYVIRDEILNVIGSDWVTTHRLQKMLPSRFPSDLNDSLREFEGTVFERRRHGRLTAWRKIPQSQIVPRPSTAFFRRRKPLPDPTKPDPHQG